MNYRHGDLALISVKELPRGLSKSKAKDLMIGSHNHAHSYDIGKFYPYEANFVIGYFVATEETKLYHKEHGKIVKDYKLRVAKIKPGIYELRRQQENTHDGMRQVID